MLEIHTFLPVIITFTLLHVIGLISPGPDFTIVVRNSLIHSRRSALFTSFGVAVGVAVHMTYTILGVGLLITKTPWLFHGFKIIGSSYLIYLGIKGILAKKNNMQLGELGQHRDISPLKSFIIGFWTNVLNIKAMLFFLSVLTVFISAGTPMHVLVILGAIGFVTTAIWFCIVAIFFSNKYMRSKLQSVTHWIDRVLGAFLIGLGVKLLFTQSL